MSTGLTVTSQYPPMSHLLHLHSCNKTLDKVAILTDPAILDLYGFLKIVKHTALSAIVCGLDMQYAS